ALTAARQPAAIAALPAPANGVPAAMPAAAPAAEAPTATVLLATAPAGHGKRRATGSHAAPATVAAVPARRSRRPDGAGAKPPPVPAEPAVAAPPPPARGAREVLAEAEKLLGQGEVAEACARGEEANRLAPKSAPVHKFLGKCYMRAGRTREAND